MTQKLPMTEPLRKRRRHDSRKRLYVHFFLFAVLAVILLAAGIYGRAQLHKITDDTLMQEKCSVLTEQVIDRLRNTAAAAADEVNTKQKRNVNNGISSKSKSAQSAALDALTKGGEAQAAAEELYDVLAEAAVSKLKDDDPDQAAVKAAVQQKLSDSRESILTDAIAATEETAQGLTTEFVRTTLHRDAPHYIPMYYSVIMLVVGGIFLLLAVFFGLVCFKASEDYRKKVANIVEPLDYLLPFFFGVILFTLYPMVRVFIMAFQERYKLTGEFVGWGIGNFNDVLFGVNTKLPQALGNTLLYVLFTVPLSTAIALILANLLNQKIKLRALFQTAYFLPMVTSATAVGLVWKFMFNEGYGIINWLLSLFNVDPIAWLTNPAYSMPVMVIYGVWDSLPMTIILLIAGLQNIDDHYYTVAKVDGAKTRRIFFRITVPLLSPTIGLVLIINSISAFKVFNPVITLFSGYPGPMYNMYTMTYYIYEQINTSLEYGRAAAASLILFVFILVFTMIQRFIQRKWTYN